MDLLSFASSGSENTMLSKLKRIEWGLWFILLILSCYGTLLLYGAAGGNWQPWALDHIVRFFVFSLIMFAVALVDIRVWYQLAYPAYIMVFIMLVGVELVGDISKGAQRWLAIGPVRLQPSEFMKITVVLALARYYQDLNVKHIDKIKNHIIPMLMVIAPAALIMKQPDLGTGSTVVLVGGIMVVLAGINWKWIASAFVGAISLFIFAYNFVLHDFQRKRVETFLNPELDKLGQGYQITQSKIAIGSGGFWGSGFMQGTQSQLDFLPERHTDFVFSMLLEEFGFVGGVFAFLLYAGVMAYGIYIATSSRNIFGKMVAGGVTVLLFIYVSINAAMIMGLVPVVGMPMPFISYGGSVMLSVMFALGLVENARVYRDKIINSGFAKK